MASVQEVQRAQEVQVIRVAPQVSVTPPPPGAAVAGGQNAPLPGGPATESLDLSKFTVRQLRQMLQELRSQRADYASRYSNLGDSYENASGANKAAMGDRLTTVGGIIVRYENEMARVGGAIVARGGGTTAEPPPGIPGNYMSEDDAAGMAFGFSFATLVLTLFFMRRYFRRKYAGAPALGRQQQPNLIASNERLERNEQAVDSIAIEVERVSENQRFMTRLMTETQLGDTIKDVRKSAELAKSAAENSG
jgi:hypothetical protein